MIAIWELMDKQKHEIWAVCFSEKEPVSIATGYSGIEYDVLREHLISELIGSELESDLYEAFSENRQEFVPGIEKIEKC